jgi:5-methylcytosine-specific restriction endonuclease McrA
MKWHKKKNRAAEKKQTAALRYAQYMASYTWEKRRLTFLKQYGRVCAACGSKQSITVHHMSYKHLGAELDGELAVLCKGCHEEFHSLNRTKPDMIAATTSFIEDKQQLLSLPV